MRPKMRSAAVRVLIPWAVCLAGPVSAQLIIDDFSDATNTGDPPGVVRTTVGSSSATDLGTSGVVGGSRVLTVEATAAGGASPEVAAGVIPSFNLLSYSSSLAADGLASLYYDANGAGLNLDLSLGDGIELSLTTDSAAVPYTVSLTLSDGIIIETDVQAGTMTGTTFIVFDYADFPTVDLSAIDNIEVVIDPSAAGDLETGGAGIVTFGEPICGNGIVEPFIGEECDDGNAFDGDGCENDCFLSTACTFAHGGLATERFVGGCGAPTFGDIQSAVSASGSGDIVSICPGTYFESVVVDAEVTIRSASGAASTTINAGAGGNIFDIQRSGVTIEDLTIVAGTAAATFTANDICGLGEGACADPGFGSNVTIRDNIVRDGAAGLNWGLAKVDCLVIEGNTITDVTDFPIRVENGIGAPSVLVRVVGNTVTGAVLNEAMSFAGHGEAFLVGQNTVEDNVDGIRLAGITAGTVAPLLVENGIRNNSGDGLLIDVGAETVRVVQNNIEGNGQGLVNQAPGGVLDATINWWGSQTGPFHATERPTGMGDSIDDTSGFDTLFVEFLCAPSPAGFPSVGGECDDSEPQEEIQFVAIGNSPDVSSNGRFISFVSGADLNGDERVTIDNSDGSDEGFLLNRKPSRRAGAFCLGGVNPGDPCSRQRDCEGNPNADPIVTDGACVLITQITNDPSGSGVTLDPRVNRRGDVVFAADADLIGANPDGSLESLVWSRREFRRNEPPDPNLVITEVSDGANVEDSTAPDGDRAARRVVFESLADLTGQNADGNREIFVYDARLDIYTQITNTIGFENCRPVTHTGRQVVFDSDADLTGQNADGNREIFFSKFKRGGWVIEQMTNTAAPVENRAGGVGRRGKAIAFSSNGDFPGALASQNADGNREVFELEKGVFRQVTDTTVGENVAPDVNPRGRFVTFESTSDVENTGATLTNRRVFLFDRKKGTTTVLSRSVFGSNFKPRVSNGRFVVWESTSNLTGSNPGADKVIYLFDRRKDN